jgi:hypothetical protein
MIFFSRIFFFFLISAHQNLQKAHKKKNQFDAFLGEKLEATAVPNKHNRFFSA